MHLKVVFVFMILFYVLIFYGLFDRNKIKVRSDQLYVGEIGFLLGLRDYINF